MSDEKDAKNVFEEAIWEAWKEYETVIQEEVRLTERKSQLRKSISALYPLAYPESETIDVNSLTLANAVRMVIGGSMFGMSAVGIRDKLEELGFDLTKYDNPLASIHTAMRRMAESEEICFVGDSKDAVPTPALKEIPKMNKSTEELFAEVNKFLSDRKGQP